MFLRKIAIGFLGVVLMVSLSGCTWPPWSQKTTSAPPTSATVAPSETASETAAAGESVSLCVPNDNADGFVPMDTVSTKSPGEIGNDLINLLVEVGALPVGVEMLSVQMGEIGDEIMLDMNAAYGQAVSSTGTAGEYMLVGTVVNTFLDYFDKHFIFLTVEGKSLTTGHGGFTDPMTYFIDQRTHYDDPLELGDIPATVAGLPEAKAVENLLRYIGGYWNSTKGEFVGFITHCGRPQIDFGLWDTEYMRSGAMTGATATGEVTAELVFLLLEQPAWEGGDGFPQEPETVIVDLDSFRNSGKLTVTIPPLNNGKKLKYTHVGKTFQEAYDAHEASLH